MKNQKQSFLTYFAIIFALILTTVSASQAATFTVDSAVDSHDTNPGDGYCHSGWAICSLRAAIEEANALPGSDVINFDSSFEAPNAPKTIFLKHGQLEIHDSVKIFGPGARQLAVDGNQKTRVLLIAQEAVNVLINGLTIQHGNSYSPATLTWAAGICNFSPNAQLASVTIRNNVAAVDDQMYGEWGGGVFNDGIMRITNSTVVGNKGGLGGGIVNVGELVVANTTIINNSSQSLGGGILGQNTTIINSTITNNQATQSGGGISVGNAGALKMINTIVADNDAPSNSDINGTITSLGNNLVKNRASSSGYVASDLPDGTSPKLGVLKDNGGQTDTRALISGSPAINAGNSCINETPSCLSPYGSLHFDQRGQGFLRKLGSSVDIGAFEFSPVRNYVEISGTVLKPNGRGLNKALVTITDDRGRNRSVETDQHGNFSFAELAADESYEIKVESQRYQYMPQMLRATEDRGDVKFVPIGEAEPPDTE